MGLNTQPIEIFIRPLRQVCANHLSLLRLLAVKAIPRLLPRSLTNRVFVLYAFVLLVFIASGVGMFLKYQFAVQVEETQRSSIMMVEVVAQAVQDSVVIGDYDTVRKTLDKSVQGSLFAAATFIDLKGGHVRATSREQEYLKAPSWLVELIAARLYDVNRSLTVGGKDYGVLRLEFDAPYVAGQLWSLSILALVVSVVGLATGLIFIRMALARWLGGLSRLAALDQSLSTGTLDVKALRMDGAPDEILRIVDMLSRAATVVREREASRRQLNNQKFAMDQHAIVTITDSDGLITYANDRFCLISGYSRDDLIGKNHRIINSGFHEKAFFENLWNTITVGKVWHGEICNRKRTGELYWVNATIVPLLGEDGRPDQYIAIRTDITDSKGLEDSLYAAKDTAEQASRAKSQFLANMSHEIRTPLNAILGMLGLLRHTQLSAQQTDYVSKTESASRSLLALLNDILDFSKVEAGMMQVDPRPFRIDQLVQELTVILSANLGAKKLDMVYDVDQELPRGLVGDDLRLKQVLINLGANAIKFTHEGRVALRIRMIERTAHDVLVEFVVQDTGIGIAPENQKHIFNGFSQAESTTTRRFGGTGLGLAISQRLVVLMGGDLQLRSALGKGSAFGFRLRFPVAKTLADVSVSGFMGLSKSEPPQKSRLTGLRLLLVEDNAINQQVARELLAKEGAEVVVAENGQLGLDAIVAAQTPFDAVLMDIQMPVMDGFTATAAIRNELGMSALPIIAMTANAMPADRENCLKAGMNDHVGKPFDLSDLVATVLRHTGLAQAQPQAQAPKPEEPTEMEVPSQLLAEAAQRSIELKPALARLGGNVRVYLRLMDAFMNDLPHLHDQVAGLLAERKTTDAARVLHTYKGLAATLGATQLRNFAMAAEQRIKAPDLGAQSDALLTGLRVAVDATLQSMTHLGIELRQFLAGKNPEDDA